MLFFNQVAAQIGLFPTVFFGIVIIATVIPIAIILVFHEQPFKDRVSLSLTSALPVGAAIAALITVVLTFYMNQDPETSSVTIETDEYVLDQGTSHVIEVYPMRSETDPTNHDAATSLIILDAGVEITEQGYTSIKAGQDVDYTVYSMLDLKLFGRATIADTIDVTHALNTSETSGESQ